MKKEYYMGAAGSAVAIVANQLWVNWLGHTAFATKVLESTSPTGDAAMSPLAPIEHHHIGLAFLLFGKPVLTGAGLTLIVQEALQDHPFGIGKSEYEVRGNIALTSILFGLLTVKMVALK